MEETKYCATVQELIIALESTLNIPENYHLIAVFENNESDEIQGWICAEYGVEGDYPLYTFQELLDKYGERK